MSSLGVAGNGGEAQGRADAQAWLQHWLAARRWQRRVERALARFDLSFFQWLVLDSLAILHRETSDAVSQVQVCRRLELGKASISRLMTRLEGRGLVDIAPAWPTKEYRIYLTREGEALLAEGAVVVEMVSRTAR
ncbi:MAG TPA: MarR family transcriptional regulator [Polyangiaceae bacterium]|nr:MarR family transcriptional regulator [Polyangiaceae bacterium]